MINFKKLLLTGIIGFVGFLGFSNGAVIREVGIFGYSPRDNNMALAVNGKGQLLSEKSQVMRDMLFINDNHNNNNGRAFFFWTNSGYPYMYKCIGGSCYEGVPYAYKICDELLSTDDPEYFVTHALNNCGDWVSFTDESKEYMNSFLSTIQNNDLYYMNTNYRTIAVAFSSSQLHKSVYFGFATNSDTGIPSVCRTCILTGSSLGFGSAIDFVSFNDSYLGQSPGVGVNYNTPVYNGTGLDGYDYIEGGSGDLIDYFENTPSYNFNMNICYIGTTDLVSVYENAIPYYEGTGYTIFDFYSKLYNTTGFSIKQVGSFVNTRYINFSTWFMGENRSAISGEPLYNAYYSFGSGFWLDQGSGLVNPFLGNLSAYYFMGSNVYQDGRITTPGEEIATYCYKKLYVEKGSPSSDGSVYNIDDNHDSSYDQNASAYIARLKNTTSYFSGANTIVSQSWTGTPLDYYDNGENITDFGGFFSSAFNKFRDSFPALNPSAFGVGFLPLYITLFLMAIIFFRFLSH